MKLDLIRELITNPKVDQELPTELYVEQPTAEVQNGELVEVDGMLIKKVMGVTYDFPGMLAESKERQDVVTELEQLKKTDRSTYEKIMNWD